MATIMQKQEEEEINSYREKLFEIIWNNSPKTQEVYAIFKEYFNEENVDIQWNKSLEDGINNLDINTLKEIVDVTDAELTKEKCTIIDWIKRKIIYDLEFNVYYIIIHYPSVTITNELDKHIDIQDLYIKVPITINGLFNYYSDNHRLSMVVTTYKKALYYAGYAHSHLPRIDYNIITFKHPCLGNGPIGRTIFTLQNASKMTMDFWKLFCYELDKYVHVESLKGGPYIKMSEVTEKGDNIPIPILLCDSLKNSVEGLFRYKNFFVDEIKTLNNLMLSTLKNIINNNKLNFRYINNRYIYSHSNSELVRIVSNTFFEVYNKRNKKIPLKKLIDNDILRKVYIHNDIISYYYYTQQDIPLPPNTKILTFKGKDVFFKLLEDDNIKETPIYILNVLCIEYILHTILKYVNEWNLGIKIK